MFSHSPVEGHLGSFQFSAITDKTSRNIHVQFLCECTLSFVIYFVSLFLGIVPSGEELKFGI